MAKTTKQIIAEISTIRKTGKTFRSQVQDCSINVIEHFKAEKDARLATRLVSALGQGVQSSKLVAYFETYGGMNWNSKKKSFNKAQDKQIKLAAAKKKLWYEMAGTADVMSDDEKLAKKMASAIELLKANEDRLAELGYTLNFKELELANNAA